MLRGKYRSERGSWLTTEMHKRGINCRHLGLVYDACTLVDVECDSQFLNGRDIVLGMFCACLLQLAAIDTYAVEIVARAFKNILRDRMRNLRESEDIEFRITAANLFNDLLGMADTAPLALHLTLTTETATPLHVFR